MATQFTSYPFTFTATSSAAEYYHSDGFRITIPANCFASSTSITISAPVKKAFFLREASATDKTAILCAGNYYKITKNSGVSPSLNFKVTVPFKTQFELDKNIAKFMVYYCTQATVEEDDPGNWYPTSGKTIPSGTSYQVAGNTMSFGYYMAAHKINGRDDY